MNPYLMYNDGGEIPTISLTDEEIEAGRKGTDKSRIKDYVEPTPSKLNALGEVDIPNMPNLGRVQSQQEKINYLIAKDKESGNTNTPEFLDTDDIIGPKTLAAMNHYEKKGAYKRPYLFSDDNLALYKKQAEERMAKKQIVDNVRIQELTQPTNPVDIMNIIGPQGKSFSIDYPMNLMRNVYASNQEYRKLANERFKFFENEKAKEKMLFDKSNKKNAKLADEKTAKSNKFDVYAPFKFMQQPLAKAPDNNKKTKVEKASSFTLPSFNYSSPKTEEKKPVTTKKQSEQPKQNLSDKYYNTEEYLITEKNKPFKDLSDNDKYNANLTFAQETLNKTAKRFYQNDYKKKYVYQIDLYEGYLDAIADAPLIPKANPEEYNNKLNAYAERYEKLDTGLNKKKYQNLLQRVFKGKEKILKSDFEKYRISVNRIKLK